jgi:hypothetical protein
MLKYSGTIRCSEPISALSPRAASSMRWFARGRISSVWSVLPPYRLGSPAVQLTTTVMVVDVVSSIKVLTTNR